MITTIKTISRVCLECAKGFMSFAGEVNRGGAKVCSRKCYFDYQKRTRPQGEESWAWKGDKVGLGGLHLWVIKHLGRPRRCEHCGSTRARKYEWANRSQKYLRDLKDWIRLCTKCHARYDYATRSVKWAKSVTKLGWKVTKIQT